MKKTVIVCLVMLPSLLFVNCEKNNPVSDLDDTFILGPTNRYVNIEEFDSLIVKLDQILIEIDGIGSEDLKIASHYTGSAGGSSIVKSEMEVLNNEYEISTINIADTTWACINKVNDTIRYTTYYTNHSGYQCDPQYIDTLLYFRFNPYPKIYVSGDTISNIGNWKQEILTLSYGNFSYPIWAKYRIILGNWNNQNMKYLVFRKNGANEYGWIKISITEQNKIQIHEIARPK